MNNFIKKRALSSKRNAIKWDMIGKKERILFVCFFLLGATLRIVNALYAKSSYYEDLLLKSLYIPQSFLYLLRFISIILSLSLAVIIITRVSAHGNKHSKFLIIFLFLFSISPIQIVLGSTINIYIILMVISTGIVFILQRSLKESLLFAFLFLILTFAITEFVLQVKFSTLQKRQNNVHILLNYENNTISLYDSLFKLRHTQQLPHDFLHKKQLSIGPDMSPLSLLVVNNFTHCNFKINTKEVDLKREYENCKKKIYPQKTLNVDYKIEEKKLLSIHIFNKTIFINTSLTNWKVPFINDGLDINNKYSIFTIQASSLYLSSPPGFDIWGKIQERIYPNWWDNIERITFSIENGIYNIYYVNSLYPYVHHLFSDKEALKTTIAWHYFPSILLLLTNVAYNQNDSIYTLISFIFLLYGFYVLFSKINKKRRKILFSASLLIFFALLIFFPFTTPLFIVSFFFLYTNILLIFRCLEAPKYNFLEIGIFICLILLSALTSLPFAPF